MGLGTLLGLGSCQPEAYYHRNSFPGLTLTGVTHEPSAAPLEDLLFQTISVPSQGMSYHPLHLPETTSPPQPTLNSPLPPKHSPQLQEPQGLDKSYTLGPLSVTAPPSSLSQHSLQLQLFSLPPIILDLPDYSDLSSSSFHTSPYSSFDTLWLVGSGISRDREQETIPLSIVGKVLRKYFFESNNTLVKTYRGVMRELSHLSHGPTQWLFGPDASSTLDLRLDTNKAGTYWRVQMNNRASFVLGYEHAVFGSDEESALRFYVSHTIGPSRDYSLHYRR